MFLIMFLNGMEIARQPIGLGTGFADALVRSGFANVILW